MISMHPPVRLAISSSPVIPPATPCYYRSMILVSKRGIWTGITQANEQLTGTDKNISDWLTLDNCSITSSQTSYLKGPFFRTRQRLFSNQLSLPRTWYKHISLGTGHRPQHGWQSRYQLRKQSLHLISCHALMLVIRIPADKNGPAVFVCSRETFGEEPPVLATVFVLVRCRKGQLWPFAV